MKSYVLNNMGVSVAMGAFLVFSIAPASAQTLSIGVFPEPGTLVSRARSPGNKPEKNLEASLVDIQAFDPEVLHEENGKIGMASTQRGGQGIIIDSSGVIATNRHIIGNAEHIFVVLAGGKKFEAHVIQDSQADLCLLKINAPFPLRAIALADSSQVQVGNPVIAFENANANAERKQGGEITNLFKDVNSNNVELLEIKMTLKPGDSGGPVLNEQGSLLGLIMANKKSDTSTSYAIASNKIQQEYFKYKNSVLN